MAVISLRVDDDLKKSLESESMKQGVSLSEYIKKSLKNTIVDTHISKTNSNLSDSKYQIEKLSKISNEAIDDVERKIINLGVHVEKYNHSKLLKRMYFVLVSVSVLFVLISVPVLQFNIEYLKMFFSN